MTTLTPSMANAKLAERNVHMRNLRKEVSSCMDRYTLTLFPPSTQYAKGLVAERDIISMKHRELAWAKNITDAQP